MKIIILTFSDVFFNPDLDTVFFKSYIYVPDAVICDMRMEFSKF